MAIDRINATTIEGCCEHSDADPACEACNQGGACCYCHARDDENSPAEFEKHLSRLTDERLLQECAKFPKAGLTTFETAALIDELCDRLRKQLDLD